MAAVSAARPTNPRIIASPAHFATVKRYRFPATNNTGPRSQPTGHQRRTRTTAAVVASPEAIGAENQACTF
jgi:hypothetical protein